MMDRARLWMLPSADRARFGKGSIMRLGQREKA